MTGLVAQQQCVGPLHTPLADVAVIAMSYFDTVRWCFCSWKLTHVSFCVRVCVCVCESDFFSLCVCVFVNGFFFLFFFSFLF